jgi:hypothetical protein
MDLTAMQARWHELLQQERGKRLLKWGRRLFMAIVIALLAYQLTQVGWGQILTSLPSNPLFYLLFLVLYLVLPVTETFVYRAVWGTSFLESFPAFLKKRVFNKDVLGYSGEVYIYLWARQRVAQTDREILGAVKDNAIVSSVASTLFAIVVLAVLFFAGQITVVQDIADHKLAYLIGAIVLGSVLMALGVRFRRTLFTLRGRLILVLFGVHLVRLVVINLLQIVQWKVALPGVAWHVWFTLLSAMIVTSRIPFLPARDMIFIGAGVGLSRMLDVSTAGIAGMLLVSSMLDKGLNAIVFSLISVLNRRQAGASKQEEPGDLSPVLPDAQALEAGNAVKA